MNNSINILYAQDDIENTNDDGINYDNDDIKKEATDKRISNTLLNSSNDNLRVRDDIVSPNCDGTNYDNDEVHKVTSDKNIT